MRIQESPSSNNQPTTNSTESTGGTGNAPQEQPRPKEVCTKASHRGTHRSVLTHLPEGLMTTETSAQSAYAVPKLLMSAASAVSGILALKTAAHMFSAQGASVGEFSVLAIYIITSIAAARLVARGAFDQKEK